MDTLLTDFVTLFVVLDPVGTAAIFATMTHAASAAQRLHMARRATILAGVILLVFALAGKTLLAALGVSLPAFRVAGGLMLFLLAVDMVFARPSGLRMTTLDEEREAQGRLDISVFPLAFPLIAGPGAMTTVVLLMGRAGESMAQTAEVLAVLLAVLAILLATLMVSGKVLRLLGVTGSNVIGRVLGIILAALAVQFVLDGVLQAVRG
jgi:multiple antibiotic resistance protein